MKRLKKGILFDIDLTLLDTKAFICQAYNYTLTTHNLPLQSEEEIVRRMGMPLEKVYEDFTSLSLASTVLQSTLWETHRLWQEKPHNLLLAQPFPHTKETLISLSQDYAIAAVTTRSKRTSIKTLEGTGLLPFISVVISREDISHPKPHPEPLLRAITLLDILPTHAVMIGDADPDIQAGKNAHIKTIGVTWGSCGMDIAKSSPDGIAQDIRDIPQLVKDLLG